MPPNGATRKSRTPSRCLQGSYAPERWWRNDGDQPWDRTTFSRASAERYDHTSSLVGLADRRGFEPRSAGSGPAVLPLDDLSMVGSGGLEPPRACARGRRATDYPTTRRRLG